MILYFVVLTVCVLFFQELLQLEDRLGSVSRGAVQTTIERFTFPHKYKKVALIGIITYTHKPVRKISYWAVLTLSLFLCNLLSEKAPAAEDW